MTLLKIQVKKLEQRLNKLDSQSPQPAASFCVGFVPSNVPLIERASPDPGGGHWFTRVGLAAATVSRHGLAAPENLSRIARDGYSKSRPTDGGQDRFTDGPLTRCPTKRMGLWGRRRAEDQGVRGVGGDGVGGKVSLEALR